MPTIKQLIQQLCPDGVEYKKLGDLLNFEQPSKYIVKSTDYDNSYNIPVLTAGQTFILGYTNESKNIYTASKNDPTIIFDDFTTSFHWVDFNFKVKSSAMKMLRPKNNNINFRFVYHAMLCIRYKPKDHARHWISKYSQFSIPVPPIAIQERIVEVLDKFTTLEAELEAELEARRKQYAYYREKLLSFPQSPSPASEIEWLDFDKVFEMRNGYTPSKAKSEFWEGGTIPWFRMEDIRKNGRILSDSLLHITGKGIKGKGLFEKNTFILATTATIGEHALLIADSLANQRFTNLKIRKSLESKINIKFMFYYMFVVDEFCKQHVNKSGFSSVDMIALKKMPIPIPPLAEQERIVGILDRFEALVNDLSQGLPAELKARRQQYEYYRDKLLTFKEKA